MNRLPKTENELSGMFANRRFMPGMHTEQKVTSGSNGLAVGETPFDAALHDPLHINPLSIWSDILDEPHVKLVLPNKELAVNIVLHRDPAERLYNPLFAPVRDFKREMAQDLSTAIEGAGEVMDRFSFYVVGDTDGFVDNGLEAEILEDTEDSEAASKAVSEICLGGLTIVLSDFYNLRLQKEEGSDDLLETLAIKVNHNLELQIPANIGKVKLPRSDIRINTKEKQPGSNRELMELNASLAEKNNQIRRNLQNLGAQVVQVSYGGANNRAADMNNADYAIAMALREIDES